MSAVTVHAAAGLAAEVAPVLASLPDDFVLTDPAGSGEVVVVDGRLQDWPVRVEEALRTARGVLLREPGVPDPAGRSVVDLVQELARRADDSAVPVVVERRWSGAPGVVSAAQAFGATTSTATSVTVLVVEDDLARAVQDTALDALGLARAAGAAGGRLTRLHRRAGSWSMWGTAAQGAVLHLQGVRSTAGAGAEVTATSAAEQTSVSVPAPSSAAPVVSRCTGAHGDRLLPTEFETAARAAWRRLRSRLGPVGGHGDELSALADDLALLRGAV